jgi:Arc/MetJ-type ribon-helix-helix transcriptional regulator
VEVSLPRDLQQFITDQVKSGVFPSASEAVCRAVETLRDQNAELLREIDLGVAEIDRNEGTEVTPEGLEGFFDNVIKQGRQRLQEQRRGELRT